MDRIASFLRLDLLVALTDGVTVLVYVTVGVMVVVCCGLALINWMLDYMREPPEILTRLSR